MNCFTHCPSCKHAIFYGYGNGYGCYLTECEYELAEYNDRVITQHTHWFIARQKKEVGRSE